MVTTEWRLTAEREADWVRIRKAWNDYLWQGGWPDSGGALDNDQWQQLANAVANFTLRELDATRRERDEARCIDTEVALLQQANADRWQAEADSYWFARLVEEIGELGGSLVGNHDDPPEHELRQIASIALNWLRKRDAAMAKDGGA